MFTISRKQLILHYYFILSFLSMYILLPLVLLKIVKNPDGFGIKAGVSYEIIKKAKKKQ